MKRVYVLFLLAVAVLLTTCATTGGTDGVSLIDAINQAAEQIAGDLPAGTRIAIVVFETESGNLSAFIIEELTGALLDRRIEVVNRQSLEYVEKELNFQMSGAVSDDTAKSVGHFLGADLVIIGQLRNVGSSYRFTANATNVQTAASASVPRFTVRNDRELRDMIAALNRQAPAAAPTRTGAAPQTAGAFLDRGLQFAMQLNFGAALADFDEAIRLNQNLAGAYVLRGRALIASASDVISVDDNFSDIHAMAYGRISLEQAQVFDRALADFDHAIRLNPNYAPAYYERCWVFYRIKGDYDQAIVELDTVLRINPNDAFALYIRGNMYRSKNDYDRAIADYTAAFRLNPNDTKVLDQRALTYLFKGDYDRAIADYTAILRINPNDAYTLGQRADSYHRKGDYDRAIADYAAMLRIDPKDDDALCGRADVYYEKGDYRRAIADYETALRINPNNTYAKEELEKARQAQRQ